MRQIRNFAAISVAALALLASGVRGDPPDVQATPFKGTLDPSVLLAHGVRVGTASYRGHPAVHLANKPGWDREAIAIVSGSSFLDGSIEVDVAGQPEAGASEGARGFIGLAFRVAGTGPDVDGFECFYVRPTNGRADDQLRRNHSTQYISAPDFPWHRLRKESPGVYESYADLEAGAWTHLRVEVAGRKARLYVNRAGQPALIVNDLKRDPARGAVALWIGSETEGWFSNLVIAPRQP